MDAKQKQTEISVSITRVWAQCLVRLGRGAKNRPGASTLFGKNREKVMSARRKPLLLLQPKSIMAHPQNHTRTLNHTAAL